MTDPPNRVEIVAYEDAHAAGIAALCDQLGWTSFADPGTVRTASTAPGVIVRVAVDGGTVVGFAQALGDTVVQSYLSNLAVAAPYRRRGIAQRLTEAAFAATGTKRMDLVTDDADDFYRALPHSIKRGYRLYPGHR